MTSYFTTFRDGTRETGINNGDGTFTITRYAADGTIVSTETLTGLPIEPLYPPLDATGALATLLVVEGVLSITDASNVLHVPEQHLIAEAEAWSLG